MRLATLAWRALLARPLRTALAVAAIALGVAIVAATTIIGSASEQALRAATAELLGAADVRIRAFAEGGFGPRALQALRERPDVVAAAAVSERPVTTVSTAPGEDERVFTLLVIGIDPEADAELRRPDLVAGRALTRSDADAALVAASFARRNGLELGDQLLLSGRRPGVPGLEIVGLVADTGFAALEGGEVLIAGREALDAAFELPSPVRFIDVDLGEAPTPERIDAVTSALDEAFVIETADDAAARFPSARSGFVGVVLLFGVVALVAGAFGIGSALAMTVGERQRELGLLRAAGTTSRQVLGMVARQAVALGVAGSALGVLAGVGLASALVGILSSTRAILVVGLPLPIGGLLAAFGVGLVVSLVAAVGPAARAAAITPLAALRPPAAGERGLTERLRPVVIAVLLVAAIGIGTVVAIGSEAMLLAILLALVLLVAGAVGAAYVLEPLARLVGRPFEWFFGAEGMLGRLNLSRDRVRTGLTVGALMIGLATVVALGTVSESARAATERRVASILPGGHAIRTALPLPVDDFRGSFEATPGIDVVSPVLELAVVRQTPDGPPEEAGLAGIDPNVFADAGSLLVSGTTRSQAFAALRDGGAVLVPESLAERAGIDVGDRIGLGEPGQPPQELTVAGLVEISIPGRTPDGALLVSSADARELFGATSSSLWIMVGEDGIADSALSASVRETAVQLAASAITPRDLAGELGGTLERLGGLFDVLALVAVVIGALGIVNTLAIGVGERVREIAVLRSNGMTVGQVQAMVVAEAAIMGAVAGVLAIGIGMLVALAVVSASGSAELSAGVVPPWALMIAVILAGTGIAALAGLYPARVAASQPIMRHLSQFE